MDPKELGYYFHPRRHDGEPGYPQMDVNVVPAPEHRHFDVREAIFLVADAFDDVQALKIHHPKYSSTYTVCMGQILLNDFAEKSVRVFSFGGALKVVNQGDKTVCSLASDAPIVRLVRDEDVPTLLAEEFEGEYARLQAAWLGRERDFRVRVANADPLTMYVSFLRNVRDRISQNVRAARADEIRDAADVAVAALAARGLWPRFPPDPVQALSAARSSRSNL